LQGAIPEAIFAGFSGFFAVKWSERQDLNLRRLAPKASALARLSYAPAGLIFSGIGWSAIPNSLKIDLQIAIRICKILFLLKYEKSILDFGWFCRRGSFHWL
jgi:hypothetical protein